MSRKRALASGDEVLIGMVEQHPCLYNHEHNDFKDFQIRENIWNHIGSSLSKPPEDCKSRWKNIRDNYLKHKRKQKQGTGSAASAKPSKWALYEYLKFLDNVKSERQTISNVNEATMSIEENVDREHSDEEIDPSIDVDSLINESLSPTQLSDPNLPKKLRQNVIADNKSRCSTPQSTSGSSSTKRTQRKNVFLEKFEERSNQRMQMLSALIQKPEEDEIDLFFKSIAMTVKKLPPHLIAKAKLGTLTLVTELQTTPALQVIQSTSNSPPNVLTPLTTFSRTSNAPESTSYSSSMPYNLENCSYSWTNE